MPDRRNLNTLYPKLSPNREQMLTVSTLHSIYVASYGNTLGIPVITLHGGPGAGTTPDFARFFDPKIYHIIVTDQRGAGKSTPHGEMRENTTQDLIADMEKIRTLFNIDKWVVFGGSWGSSLALLYAEAHPGRVSGLLLRGIFLVREDDISAFVRDNSPAALLKAREWQAFKKELDALIAASGLPLSTAADKIYHIVYKLLQHPDTAVQKAAASAIARWEKRNSYLEVDASELEWGDSPDGVNMGLTEATYFEHGCFLRHNQILEDIEKIKDIPVYIVHGLYDIVCPGYMADELEDALLAVNTDQSLVVRMSPLSGHSQWEPETTKALVTAAKALAKRLQDTEQDKRNVERTALD
ncbi:proline iminopeptidase [Legionella geestiana]|uniref:Proline iminopeptidase n=1 Tax=Legionella geestiana TaxID=45065 RepID=A0A0W0UA63_9GAMM|nr:prolyl aminopeptidase [Legionella geestiana]KTD04888.1 proline iminopeptidase [Legionella geestiana]STX54077.1 proline iminopeptidase [Legionella geestiana]